MYKVNINFIKSGSTCKYQEFGYIEDAMKYAALTVYHLAHDSNEPVTAVVRNYYNEVLIEMNNEKLFTSLNK